MLERYFIRPKTVDRIRSSWIGPEIERYVTWLVEHGYAARNIFHRVPVLYRFGEFARTRGATASVELPAHVDAFVETWVRERGAGRKTAHARKKLGSEARNPVEQMLTVVLPEFSRRPKSSWASRPFHDRAGRFFEHLADERGLRPASILHYKYHLARFETYLQRVEVRDLRELSPVVLSGFITDCAGHLGRTAMRDVGGVLRVFLRYLHREQLIAKDLSACVESPRAYRLSRLPRSISWTDVQRVLDTVDRRTAAGKRDYAVLLLLVTYGLRGREVAALTLDDLDWRRERLRIRERKAGHSTAYPLSTTVGAALLDYLQHARPATKERALFFRVLAPLAPFTASAVSSRAAYYLHQAGIAVPRAGSHTQDQLVTDPGHPWRSD